MAKREKLANKKEKKNCKRRKKVNRKDASENILKIKEKPLKNQVKISKMPNTKVHLVFIIAISFIMCYHSMDAKPYDPDDKEIETVIPKEGTFEAFYPREMYGIPNGASRAPHSHGSFFKYRHPALIESKNSAAYGYRFDGKRRFNFD